jgi:hypothetical protein
MASTISDRLVPTRLVAWMLPFQQAFAAPTWRHVLVLIVGTILTPGRRTAAVALRVIGLEHDPHFTNYHRVLNRNCWSSRQIACCLLRLLIATFVPTGPVVIGLDDTLERRWGAKIKARGIYRDPVRSSDSHLRWLSLMLLPQIPWARRVWALPFLIVLAPSERYARKRQQRHKRLTDWGRQMLLQAARWLPDRRSPTAVCRYRTAQRRAPLGLYDHPPAPRCPTIRSTTASPSWHDGAAARGRQAAADACQTSRQPQNPLAPLPSNRLVWSQ